MQMYHTTDPKLAQQSPKLMKKHTIVNKKNTELQQMCTNESPGPKRHNPGRMRAHALGLIQTDPSFIPDLC